MSFLRRSSKMSNDSSTTHMPAFLQQSSAEVQKTFEELEWHQRKRWAEGMRKTAPGAKLSQWAGVSGAEIIERNRYTNIYPWQSNRVKLEVQDGQSDYINASPIALKCTRGGNVKRYIATQGPTSNSVPHIWRMVLQQTGSPSTPAVIIMLTQTHDSGKEKCFQYYPHSTSDSPLHISPGTVTLLSSHYDDAARTTVRTLSVSSTESGITTTKKVYHLLFSGWPDFGVPEGLDRVALLALVKLSAKLNEGGPENPRIVHCSAGVGRSGTFIALDYLLTELEEGSFEGLEHEAHQAKKRRSGSGHAVAVRESAKGEQGFEDDRIADTVDRLRQQRMMMVQGESQFHFLYELVREQWLEKQGRMREAEGAKREIVEG